jgi:hypothetical protein
MYYGRRSSGGAKPRGNVPRDAQGPSTCASRDNTVTTNVLSANSRSSSRTVNRVALLSNGEYNVPMIAVNGPHHIFVSKNFKVVGAL